MERCSTGSGRAGYAQYRGIMGYKRLELGGKVAVVIGGNSGIGQVLACGLAEAGADVVPSARRIEQVKATADKIDFVRRRASHWRRILAASRSAGFLIMWRALGTKRRPEIWCLGPLTPSYYGT